MPHATESPSVIPGCAGGATARPEGPALGQPRSLGLPGGAAAPEPPMGRAGPAVAAAVAAEPQTFCLHGDFPSPLGAAAAKPKSGLFGCRGRLRADCPALFPLAIIHPELCA